MQAPPPREARRHRRRAQPLLVAPKTESVTTWSEFVRLARGSDDEPDPNANAAADDMDTLTLARGKADHGIARQVRPRPAQRQRRRPALGPGRKTP